MGGCRLHGREITVYTVDMSFHKLAIVLFALLLAACAGSLPPAEPLPRADRGHDVAIFAMSLVDTDYRFGGKNPEAGFDCSGMVAYIYTQASGLTLRGSAADLARAGRPVAKDRLRPGDLLFFNTRNAPFSHVGIYLGEQRFVHAPATRGKVRIDRLDSAYFARRYEAARTFFD